MARQRVRLTSDSQPRSSPRARLPHEGRLLTMRSDSSSGGRRSRSATRSRRSASAAPTQNTPRIRQSRACHDRAGEERGPRSGSERDGSSSGPERNTGISALDGVRILRALEFRPVEHSLPVSLGVCRRPLRSARPAGGPLRHSPPLPVRRGIQRRMRPRRQRCRLHRR